MPRLIFPNGEDRLVYTTPTAPNQPLNNFNGLQLNVYLNEDCTTIADIRNADGSPNLTSTIVVGTDSLMPLFQGPDSTPETDTLYVRPSGASDLGQRIHSRYDDRLDGKLNRADGVAFDSDRLGGVSASSYSTTAQNNVAYVAKTLVDVKGDLIVATEADTVGRLPVGANGLALIADSAAASGLKWASAGGVFVNIKDYGAIGNNVANDTAAVQAALNVAGAKTVWVPPGTYRVNNLTMTVAETTLMGPGKFIKNGNGAMMSVSGNQCRVYQCSWDGNGANFTGPGIYISGGGTDFIWDAGWLTGTQSWGIEFTSGAGARSRISGVIQANAGLASIKMVSGVEESNGDRVLQNVFTGGTTLADLSGCSTVAIIGCGMGGGAGGLIFTNASKKVMVTATRFGVAGSTTAIMGQDHTFTTNEHAGPVTLAGTNHMFVANRVIGSITNNSTGSQVSLNAITA